MQVAKKIASIDMALIPNKYVLFQGEKQCNQ